MERIWPERSLADAGGRHRLVRSPAILSVLWAAWLSFPYLFLGPLSYARSHDNADGVLAQFLASGPGGGGYWNPQPACGIDRVSALTIAVAFQWSAFILPGWLALLW